jgi:ABC-2 type transport system ATP-binding protein
VGVLIDASAQHSGRRGAEALATSAQLMGVERNRVKEMLDLVDLDSTAARKRVGKYSLGMRQRLGIAHALLGDPEVLIFDEPANGLDPEGMRWMRALLRDFADRGGTVLLSSHLLGEVSAIADNLIVIARGEIVAQGTPGELSGAAARTTVRTADGPAADRVLRRELAELEIVLREGPDGSLVTEAEPAEVGRAALRSGVALAELRTASDSASLEQLFFQLTADTKPEVETRDLEEAAR